MGLQYIIGNIQSATNQCVQTQTFISLEPRTPLERNPRHFSEIKDFQTYFFENFAFILKQSDLVITNFFMQKNLIWKTNTKLM